MKPAVMVNATVFRIASTCLLVLGSAGCSTQTLGSVAAAMAVNTSAERTEERVELQALAEKSANAEKAPQLETEAAYLQVVAQLQTKQLWFASLAHLDVLEGKWKPSDASQLLRADALRHTGLERDSRVIYQRLVGGSKAGKALHGLGLLAAQGQQYSLAVQQLTAARDLAPTDAVLLSDLGVALLHAGQSTAARIPLMQAAQLQPGNSRIQSNVALFLVLHGDARDASIWMQQHQMSEAQRAQVFQLAQQLASVPQAIAAPSTPSESVETTAFVPSVATPAPAPAPEGASKKPLQRVPGYVPTDSVRTTTAAATTPSQWMTETSNFKGQP